MTTVLRNIALVSPYLEIVFEMPFLHFVVSYSQIDDCVLFFLYRSKRLAIDNAS